MQASILEPGQLITLEVGKPGELCLAGLQVAEGCRKDSEATAKFIIEGCSGIKGFIE